MICYKQYINNYAANLLYDFTLTFFKGSAEDLENVGPIQTHLKITSVATY